MTMTVLDRALVADDAGSVTGKRQERPDPEVPKRARRRTFTAQYKLEILAAYDAAPDGEKGAMLCREGLHSGLISEWRRARDAGATCAAIPRCSRTVICSRAPTSRRASSKSASALASRSRTCAAVRLARLTVTRQDLPAAWRTAEMRQRAGRAERHGRPSR